MADRDTSRVSYKTSQGLMDLLRYTAETLSREFDRWDEQYVSGPSLYFVLVADVNFVEYTDPLGANRWPVDRCDVVSDSSTEAFLDAARDVAFSCDGAVVIAGDGTIQRQMVRVRSPGPGGETAETLSYPEWMGTKHLSALEVSTREEVLWVVTLSEEDGRVTSFLDGTYQDYPRSDIGGRWRSGD